MKIDTARRAFENGMDAFHTHQYDRALAIFQQIDSSIPKWILEAVEEHREVIGKLIEQDVEGGAELLGEGDEAGGETAATVAGQDGEGEELRDAGGVIHGAVIDLVAFALEHAAGHEPDAMLEREFLKPGLCGIWKGLGIDGERA